MQGEGKMRKLLKFGPEAAAVCALALALSGCAGSSIIRPFTSSQAPAVAANSNPVPRVQDCIVVAIGTPSKFVCNGKTYTSHELRKMREQAAQSTVASTN
jgi:hypothetical protein